VADRPESGVLDTCVFMDLERIDPQRLPVRLELTAITFAELQQGVAMARTATDRVARMERLGMAVTGFDPLVFDGEAAARYGSFATLTVEAGRSPRPRRLDLMIAAIASVNNLPLFTRNIDDFKGLERAVTVVEV